jgi:hypothetical protein
VSNYVEINTGGLGVLLRLLDNKLCIKGNRVKNLAWLILFYSIGSHAETLSKSTDSELAHILTTFEVLYKSNNFPIVAVIQTWEEISECDGIFESCPNARLFITVNSGDLYEVPLLYELPKSKGWKFVDYTETEQYFFLSVATTMEHANVTLESRKKWQSRTYKLKISKSDDGLVSLVE